MLDYLLFWSLLSVSCFSLTKVRPTLFCLRLRSAAGKGVGRKWPGRGRRDENDGTSAQMTARSFYKKRKRNRKKKGVSLGPCEEAMGTASWHEQLMWKKCVLFQYGRCRCENTCWQVGPLEKCAAMSPLLSLAARTTHHLMSVGLKLRDQREAASNGSLSNGWGEKTPIKAIYSLT